MAPFLRPIGRIRRQARVDHVRVHAATPSLPPGNDGASWEIHAVNIRVGALVALLIAATVMVVAAATAAAWTAGEVNGEPTPAMDGGRAWSRSRLMPSPQAPEPIPAIEVAGIGSNYPGTAGWLGEPTAALPGDLGGRYTGEVNGHVTVCADRCARLPVVDWCQCHWGTDGQRVVDLSHAAWAIVSDAPLVVGLVDVRLILDPWPELRRGVVRR